MATHLTKMLTGEIPCVKLYEDERVAAVLEPAPLSPGHAFVFPKREAESWVALEPSELAEVLSVARRLAEAIARAFPCRRVALAAYGVKTPHVHFHLIPADGSPGEIDLTRTRPAAPAESLRDAASKIAIYLNS